MATTTYKKNGKVSKQSKTQGKGGEQHKLAYWQDPAPVGSVPVERRMYGPNNNYSKVDSSDAGDSDAVIRTVLQGGGYWVFK